MKRVLYVYAKGGTALEHAFPRIAACAELHVLALMPLPTAAEELWRPHCASIAEAHMDPGAGDAVADEIVRAAERVGADAVLTLSEFAVLAAAHAADRLGLPGPGSAAAGRARDKRLMRETWQAAGVPVPAFRRVGSEAELRTALTELTPPVLLKSAWSAGSIAQVVLDSPEEAPSAWARFVRAREKGRDIRMSELYEPDADGHLIVEEIVEGSAGSWYDRPGYADYVSVEGIVANGVHHPLCITARLPPIPPFNEVASTAPCVLPEASQRRVEEISRQAVDALKLDTCGTHTELKLMADGRVAVIETAARFGGVMITREIEEVFGLDPIALLVRQLLGERVDYPERMLIEGRGAAASLVVVPADAAGVPWSSRPRWSPGEVDWSRLLSPGSAVEPVAAFELPPGSPIPVYDPAAGAANWLGLFVVTAADAGTLLKDCNSVLNGLESGLG
ncbi:ATP-grasp domain-containing protein [Streptomyces katsurahamanus]|uniref:ATP-grasp domain-containing protein n=1 Tax=Streptomyces katsurahamanus TaxID=2577098 RepID=A0ABW9P2F6_9ACTN|nr:ATP-grasp domain-containing protein [Streptomyces katsurahamanus]MQS39685.1 ATP-grasp domain-containing protein [Streptomyces katsurahamanus]